MAGHRPDQFGILSDYTSTDSIMLSRASVTYSTPLSTFTQLFSVTVGNSLLNPYATFVCDGVADEVQINEAINYVSARGGGKVIILPGVYYQSAIVNNQTNVTVEGTNSAVTILRKTANIDLMGMGTGKSSMHVSKLRFEGNGFNSANEGIQFTGCTNFSITDCEFDGMYIGLRGDGTYYRIERNKVIDSKIQGINIAGTAGFIDHNIVDDAAEQFGIVMGGYCNGIMVTNNNVKGVPEKGGIQRGYSGEKNLIANNIIENCGNGLEIGGKDANGYNYTKQLLMANNVIKNCINGITAQRKVEAAQGHVMKDIIMQGNQIIGGSDSIVGIAIGTMDSGIVVKDNVIRDMSYGIRNLKTNMEYVEVSGNSISNMSVQGIANSSSHWYVTGNKFRDITFDAYINNDSAGYTTFINNYYAGLGRDLVRNTGTGSVITPNYAIV